MRQNLLINIGGLDCGHGEDPRRAIPLMGLCLVRLLVLLLLFVGMVILAQKQGERARTIIALGELGLDV